jgi:hypothetical protein
MRWVMVGLLVGLLAGWLWVGERPLSTHAQIELPTATPDAEGNIYVIVQPNDSMWLIAARAGITIERLWELNGLSEASVIRPGDRLLVAQVEPAPTPTPEPTERPTLPPPTPSRTPPPAPVTAVCLTAFVDQNQDGVQDPGEPLRAAVAFTIFNEQAVVANYISDGQSEPHCLELPPGTYRLTRSVGRDEALSNDGDVALLLRSGDLVKLAFGSYNRADERVAETAIAPEPTVGGGEAMGGAERPLAEPTPVAPAIMPEQPGFNWLAWGVFALVAVLLGAAAIFLMLVWRR